MPKVLVTGMSGTGKSAALQMLGERGHRVVDTDTDQWCRWVTGPDGSPDWIWREDAIAALLASHRHGHLFVAGCKTNQGRFYSQFDHIVLLSAPADVMLARIAARAGNPYGQDPGERALILAHLAEVEPLLRATATIEIDTTAPLSEVVRQLEDLTSFNCLAQWRRAVRCSGVTHASILNITFDCADARAQAMFWAAVTGWDAQEKDATPGHVEYAVVSPSAGMPRLYFTTVPEPKTTKNRVHLDIIPPGDQQAELGRLLGLGATVLGGQPPDAGWIILADPEGNEFCLEG